MWSADCCNAKVITFECMFLDFVFSVFSVCCGSTEDLCVSCMYDVHENKYF